MSSAVSSSSSPPCAESAIFICAAVRPPWLEWASSMRMANVRPRCSLPISSRMNGNFCTVVMMIFLPACEEPAQVPRVLGVPHRGGDLGELLDGVADLLVEHAPVGDHDDRVEDVPCCPAPARRAGGPARRWSCSCRCLPSAGSGSAGPRRAVARRRGACAPRRAGGSAGRSAPAFLRPVRSSFSSTTWA